MNDDLNADVWAKVAPATAVCNAPVAHSANIMQWFHAGDAPEMHADLRARALKNGVAIGAHQLSGSGW